MKHVHPIIGIGLVVYGWLLAILHTDELVGWIEYWVER